MKAKEETSESNGSDAVSDKKDFLVVGIGASAGSDQAMECVIRQLEEDLQSARAQLRTTIEQYEISSGELKASNEKLLAINEELRSSTAELERGKESLQSVNEELTTVNQELKTKLDEVARANSDLEDLIRAADIATIFLDRNLAIKLYTPAAAEIFNLIPSDAGRPLKDITHTLEADDFIAEANRVLERLTPVEREHRSKDGRFFIARFLPYRSTDEKIDGVVLSFIDVTERVVSREKQLQMLAEITSAHKFSDAVLEQMPAGVIVANAEEMFVFGNRKMAQIVGSAGSVGDEYREWDLRNSQDQPLTPEQMPMSRALNKGETIVSEEMHLRHPGGSTTVISVNAAPIVGEDGQIVGGVVAFEDITRRVRAEISLRSSEERYRSLFNSIDEGFCIIEMIFDDDKNPVDFRFLEVSPSFEKQTGLKNVQGQRMRELVPNHEEHWFEVFGKVAITGEPARFDNRAEQLNSWYDVYAFRFGDPEKAQVAVLFNNVIDRKRTEEALRKSEERLRLMSESFTDYAIFMSDLEGRVLSWNTGAEKIFEYNEDEMIGKTVDILFTPEDREQGVPEKEMETARETGRASDERWHLRKDGSRFFASGVMAPIFNEGVLVGYAKIARDLTEAKKIEEELHRYRNQLETLVEERTAELEQTNASLRQEMLDRQRAEEQRIGLLRRIVTTQEDERRRIARDMHDQLGQQLTALRLRIATLGDGTSTPLSQQIENLQEAAAKLDAEVGFLAWELRPAALDDLGFVAATQNFVTEWSRHYGIPAELHAGNLMEKRLAPEVETNFYRIAQEALNNIYKHADARNANVVIERRKGDIVLIIEDDGNGFEPSDIRPNDESGRGLGLVGMRERAAIVGGTLEIESAPGKGTTIFARAPMKEQS